MRTMRDPTIKPPWGAMLDRSHEFAQGLLRAWVFNEGDGVGITDVRTGAAGTLSGSVWNPGKDGVVISHDDATDRTYLCSADFLPLDRLTIVIGYRKRDGTARVSGAFGVDSEAIVSEDQTGRCGAHLPFSDGTVYFDFGGTDASHRLSAAGLTFGDDVWAFTAGPRGMEIWQNGVLAASNASATGTRTVSTLNFALGTHGFSTSFHPGSDLADYRFLYVYNEQIPAEAIAQISARPYQVIAPDALNRFTVSAGSSTQNIGGAGVTDADSFGAGAINPGAVSINGTGFSDADAFGTGVVATGSVSIDGAGFTDANSFGSGAIAGAGNIAGSGFADPDSFGAGDVSLGAVTVGGAGFSDADSFGIGTLSTSASIAGAAFTDADSFGAGSLSLSSLSIAGTGFASGNMFGTASISPGAVSIDGSAFSDPDAFGHGRIGSGITLFSVVLTGSRLESAFTGERLGPGLVGERLPD